MPRARGPDSPARRHSDIHKVVHSCALMYGRPQPRHLRARPIPGRLHTPRRREPVANWRPPCPIGRERHANKPWSMPQGVVWRKHFTVYGVLPFGARACRIANPSVGRGAWRRGACGPPDRGAYPRKVSRMRRVRFACLRMSSLAVTRPLGGRRQHELPCDPHDTPGAGEFAVARRPRHRRSSEQGQAHLPAEQPSSREDSRFPPAHADPCGSRHPGGAPSQGPRRTVRLTRHRRTASCCPLAHVCGGVRTSGSSSAGGLGPAGAVSSSTR